MADSSAHPPVLAGAEPLSHVAGSATGVLVMHGFTGNPSSVRSLAEAFIAAGFDVEITPVDNDPRIGSIVVGRLG